LVISFIFIILNVLQTEPKAMKHHPTDPEGIYMSFKHDLYALLHWHPNWHFNWQRKAPSNWLLISFLLASAALIAFIKYRNLATPFLSSPALF
jgi:hypothetical protein